jgi:hypothetical protein
MRGDHAASMKGSMMRGFRRWSWTTAFALVLGCASPEEGVAQDQAPAQQPAPGGGAAATPKAPAPKFDAMIKDRFLTEPWQLREAILFVPEVSLFGGGGGEETRELVIKVGAAELTVPLSRVARIEIGEQDEDVLHVTVLVRPTEGDATPQPVKGTVRSSLELRGMYGASDLKTTVKLRELTWLDLVTRPS